MIRQCLLIYPLTPALSGLLQHPFEMFSCFISGTENPPSTQPSQFKMQIHWVFPCLKPFPWWSLASSSYQVRLSGFCNLVLQLLSPDTHLRDGSATVFCFFSLSHFEPCCLSLWCPTLVDFLVCLIPAVPSGWSPTNLLIFSFCISPFRDLFPSILLSLTLSALCLNNSLRIYYPCSIYLQNPLSPSLSLRHSKFKCLYFISLLGAGTIYHGHLCISCT